MYLFESGMVNNNLRGSKLEKEGDVDGAIQLYEYNVAHRFSGNHPYDRLSIIYRRQKRYEDEVRVLEMAVDVFTNDVPDERPDKNKKLDKFKERLAKARSLIEAP